METNKVTPIELSEPYLSIRDFVRKYKTWTEPSIRWLIWNNTNNFNDKVVRKVGSKILLSVDAFWEWIEYCNRQSRASSLEANKSTFQEVS